MKNKGFTLIELLGVIIILALLMIIVFPSIINSVKNSSNKTDGLTKELIYNAANLFIDDHINDFPKMNGSKYSIELSTLVGEGLLTGPIKLSGSNLDITNSKCIQVTYNNGYKYELKDSGSCKEIIKYSLPEEYQQVEYIQSTGTQYIVTDYYFTLNDEIEIGITPMSSDTDSAVFGAYESSDKVCELAYLYNRFRGNLSMIDQTNDSSPVYEVGTKYDLKFVNNYWNYEGTNFGSQGVTSMSVPSYLFARNYSDKKLSQSKVYYLIIYRNGNLIVNFVPCYRKSDNVIGMYDIANNVFYTNAGTGEFKKGDNV